MQVRSRSYRRFIIFGAVLIGAVIAVICLVFLRQDSPQKTIETDADRYASIKNKCIDKYNADTAKGVRYIDYPCRDEVLQKSFVQMYGRHYKQ